MVARLTDERDDRLEAQRRSIAHLMEAVRLKDRAIAELKECLRYRGLRLEALEDTVRSLRAIEAALRERLRLAGLD